MGNKISIVNLLDSFGNALHLTHPVVLKKICKQFVEYRSTFAFDQYVEGIWTLLCLHFIASGKQSKLRTNELTLRQNEVEPFLLSKQQITELFKTLVGRLSDSDPSFMENEIVIKLLQIDKICSLLRLSSLNMEQTSWTLYKTMLRDGLQSEISKRYANGGWDRNAYNILVLDCINSVLYGETVASDSFLMKNKYEMTKHGGGGTKNKRMQFDHVENNGLIVDLCVDDRDKRGIAIIGPNDVFVDNAEKLRGAAFMNYHLLTAYCEWNMLCLNWQIHQTKEDIVAAVTQWFEETQQQQHKQSRRAISFNKRLK